MVRIQSQTASAATNCILTKFYIFKLDQIRQQKQSICCDGKKIDNFEKHEREIKELKREVNTLKKVCMLQPWLFANIQSATVANDPS